MFSYVLLLILEELKANADGVERSSSGVSYEDIRAEIIYALALPTGRKGRSAMTEKFKKKEGRLSPIDEPMELLEKLREHRSNVSLLLKKVADESESSAFTSMLYSVSFEEL